MSRNKEKKTKAANDVKQARLPAYLTNVKRKHLTSTRISVLELCRQGKYPAQIAKALFISRSAVSQHMKRLAELGYIDKPHLTKSTGGAYAHPLDVRWRGLKWILAKPVKLPYDDSRYLHGVFMATWRVKEATITMNYGKRHYSLEITSGLVEGDTVDQVCRKHDEQCVAVFRWVAEHYPELKQVANEYGYIVNRMGEVNVKPLKPFAEKYLREHGRLQTTTVKIDDSDGDEGHLQFLLQGIASKSDIVALHTELGEIKGLLQQLVGAFKGFAADIKTLLGGPAGEDTAPKAPKELDKNNKEMYR